MTEDICVLTAAADGVTRVAVGGKEFTQGLEKWQSVAPPCKRYSLRLCYFQTPIPLPPSHMGRGIHRFGFSSYEGAAATAVRRSKRKKQKNPLGFSCFFR